MVPVYLAFLGCLLATFFDLKYAKIPNWIPAGMFLLSLPLVLLEDPVSWLLNLFSAFLLFYFFWELRVWAAGDSKLFIALAVLLPKYPETAFLPAPPYAQFFYLTLVFNLLAIYLVVTALRLAARNPWKDIRERPASTLLFATFLALAIAGFIPFIYLFIAAACLLYELASRHRFTHRVPACELRVGDNLAESIIEKNGGFERKKEVPPSTFSLLKEAFSKDPGELIRPGPEGITLEEKDRLSALVAEGQIDEGFEVYSGMKMSPLILSSLLVSVFLGDLFSAML